MKEELPHKHSMMQFDGVDDVDLYDPTKIAVFHLNRRETTKYFRRVSVYLLVLAIVFPFFAALFLLKPVFFVVVFLLFFLVPLIALIGSFSSFKQRIRESTKPVLEVHLAGLKLAYLGICDFDLIPWQEISAIKSISRFGMKFVVIQLNSLDQLLDHAVTDETRRQIEMAWHSNRLMEKLGLSMLAQPPISVPEFWLQLPAKDVADILDYRRSCFLQLGSTTDKK